MRTRDEFPRLFYVPVEGTPIADGDQTKRPILSKRSAHIPACQRVRAAASVCHVNAGSLQLAYGTVRKKRAGAPVFIQNLLRK